jgi:hypothetical protein
MCLGLGHAASTSTTRPRLIRSHCPRQSRILLYVSRSFSLFPLPPLVSLPLSLFLSLAFGLTHRLVSLADAIHVYLSTVAAKSVRVVLFVWHVRGFVLWPRIHLHEYSRHCAEQYFLLTLLLKFILCFLLVSRKVLMPHILAGPTSMVLLRILTNTRTHPQTCAVLHTLGAHVVPGRKCHHGHSTFANGSLILRPGGSVPL